MQKLLVYSIFRTEYSRELSVQLAETKWHGAVLDLIIMLNGTFVLLPMLTAAREGGALLGDSL
jgi:hypothetical protein